MYRIKVNDIQTPPKVYAVATQGELFKLIREALKAKQSILTIETVDRVEFPQEVAS